MESTFNLVWQMLFTGNADLMQIVLLSIRVSLSAVFIATLIGLPLAALMVTCHFPLKRFIIILSNTLLGMPSVVLGLLFYLLLSRAGPLGSLGLLFTPTAMIIAQTFLVIPIIIALARNVLDIEFKLHHEFFFSLRMTKWKMALSILYESRLVLITIILTAFGRAISEVGAVMIVGGNINHVTRVMTTTIAMETNKGNLALSLSLGMVLMIIVLSVNLAAALFARIQKKGCH